MDEVEKEALVEGTEEKKETVPLQLLGLPIERRNVMTVEATVHHPLDYSISEGTHTGTTDTQLTVEKKDPLSSQATTTSISSSIQPQRTINLTKCEYCRRIFLGDSNVTPSATGRGVVHNDCAEQEKELVERKREEDERVREMSSDMDKSVHPERVCVLCQMNEYRRRSHPLRDDIKWIKPCFCNVFAHHACFSSVVQTRKRCAQCGVKYKYNVYGSLFHYLSRYRVQYGFCVISIGIFLISSIFVMWNVIFYPSNIWSASRMILLIIGLFISAFTLCCFISFLKYTMHRFPQFRSKYKYVTVSDYTPPSTKVRGGTSIVETGRDKSYRSLSLVNGNVSVLVDEMDPLNESIVLKGRTERHIYPYASTPKIRDVPLDFKTPQNVYSTNKKIEIAPITIQMDLLDERSSRIEYDDTPKENEEEKERPKINGNGEYINSDYSLKKHVRFEEA